MVFKGIKVLVAGATGLIGSNLLTRLLEEGAQVRATLYHRDPVIKDPRIQYLRCDLRRPEDCARAVAGMQHVHLCAASTSGAAAIAATPMIHVTPNVLINSQMLEAAYNAGVEKFVWLGSTVAYPMSPRPMREEELMLGEPFDKYFFAGWAKRFMEVLCQMYGEKLTKRMTTIVLRPTNVYGPNDDFEFATSHVIPALIRKVVERWDPLEVWGDGSEVRDAIYVDDMIEAMVLAASTLDAYSAINIGLGKGYSVKEILRTILEEDGYAGARIAFDPSKPTMIPIRLIDTGKAESVLGFKAKVDLREGVRKTIAWYRETRGLPRPCGR
jgi:GDP-L-fucose synthase